MTEQDLRDVRVHAEAELRQERMAAAVAREVSRLRNPWWRRLLARVPFTVSINWRKT